jgi:hypothetical protein
MKKSTSPKSIASTLRRLFLSRQWRDSQFQNVSLTDAICQLSKAIEDLTVAMREDAGGEEQTETQ